jgi:8-oxo-dGTP pyrophosphatase MutT (NUDIX family)
MELLRELRDDKFSSDDSEVEIREASRVVAIDEDGSIPLLFVSKQNYHKLPGGGINGGEDRMDALHREVLEETGCKVDVIGELGEIVEYRSAINFNWKSDLKQISYCYWGKVISKNNVPDFTKEELSEGLQLAWLSLEKAIKTIESDNPKNFEGSFIQKRDLEFLKKFKSNLLC